MKNIVLLGGGEGGKGTIGQDGIGIERDNGI